jgi:hypothetical protein
MSESFERSPAAGPVAGLSRIKREVNFDYYPTWEGESKVIELSMQRAREMHLAVNP